MEAPGPSYLSLSSLSNTTANSNQDTSQAIPIPDGWTRYQFFWGSHVGATYYFHREACLSTTFGFSLSPGSRSDTYPVTNDLLKERIDLAIKARKTKPQLEFILEIQVDRDDQVNRRGTQAQASYPNSNLHLKSWYEVDHLAQRVTLKEGTPRTENGADLSWSDYVEWVKWTHKSHLPAEAIGQV